MELNKSMKETVIRYLIEKEEIPCYTLKKRDEVGHTNESRNA